MQMRKKYKGYVQLPCFTVEFYEDDPGADLTCNRFLGWIWETFFAPFWDGGVVVTEVEDAGK